MIGAICVKTITIRKGRKRQLRFEIILLAAVDDGDDKLIWFAVTTLGNKIRGLKRALETGKRKAEFLGAIFLPDARHGDPIVKMTLQREENAIASVDRPVGIRVSSDKRGPDAEGNQPTPLDHPFTDC